MADENKETGGPADVMSSEAAAQGRDRQPGASPETRPRNAPDADQAATPEQVKAASDEAAAMQAAPVDAGLQDPLSPQSGETHLQFRGVEAAKERKIREAKADKGNH